MTGDGSGRRLRAALIVGLMLACQAASPVRAFMPERAPDEIAAIVSRLEAAVADLSSAREANTDADARLTTASGRLAALLGIRGDLDAQIDTLEAEVRAAQARLDAAAVGIFMEQGGSQDASMLAAIIGSGSIVELADRMALAEASADATRALAREAAVSLADLDARRDVVDLLIAGQAVLVGQVRAARDRASATASRLERSIGTLERERDEAVALVQRLRARPGHAAAPDLDLDGLARALQGEESMTYGRWAEAFLGMLGAPPCRDNLVLVVAWQAQEGTQAAWNPLATTHRMPGSTDFNSVGVQNFTSAGQGLQATWETLRGGWEVYRYAPIVEALRRCAPATITARAVNASSWCPGCLAGRYLLDVVPKVEADLDVYLAL